MQTDQAVRGGSAAWPSSQHLRLGRVGTFAKQAQDTQQAVEVTEVCLSGDGEVEERRPSGECSDRLCPRLRPSRPHCPISLPSFGRALPPEVYFVIVSNAQVSFVVKS